MKKPRDLLRYRETHGQDPSTEQMDKVIQINQTLEEKEYSRYSYDYDSGESDFLRQRERDLLFRHGLSYDTSRDLDLSKSQINKSLEKIQRQMEQTRVHARQMDLSL
jgi:hypothetical protein